MSTTPPHDEDGVEGFIDCIRNGNERWMSTYPGRPHINGSAKAVVLTCMDSRIPPIEMLGLAPGEVFIVRNAGNSLTNDTLRSLLICLTVMECRKVLVVGHSQCGMRSCVGLDRLLTDLVDPVALMTHLNCDLAQMHQWFGFHDLTEEEWVLLQVRELRKVLSKVMPAVPIRVMGAVYHLEDGRLEWLGSAVPENDDQGVA